MEVVAINGSPRMGKGNTAALLGAFLEGMAEAGANVKLFYATQVKAAPCACGMMYCWYQKPGECCFKDGMDPLYTALKAAEILILATPVYIPLPGEMQNVLNRLCPLLEPFLEWREGRTRARMRQGVLIHKIVLVATCDWWELGNFDRVVHIARELAEDASIEFAGAVLRPHASMMKREGEFTPEGEAVLAATHRAGYELAAEGRMCAETLEAVSRPLISEQDLRARYHAGV